MDFATERDRLLDYLNRSRLYRHESQYFREVAASHVAACRVMGIDISDVPAKDDPHPYADTVRYVYGLGRREKIPILGLVRQIDQV